MAARFVDPAGVDTPLAKSNEPRICRCVMNHNPNYQRVHVHHIHPVGEGGPKVRTNEVFLCPTAHDNVHDALTRMLKGEPNPLRNGMLSELAHRGFEAITAARLKVPGP